MEGKHPVSLLQELMARQYKKLPEYIIIDISTKLCPKFKCKVRIEGIEGVAIASSKQNAKKLAAQDALKQLGFGADNKITEALNHYQSNIRQPTTVNYNAIGKLNEYAAKSRLSYPSYDECGINSNNEFIIKCSIMDYSVKGSAPTKKVAKQVAANNMLKYLEDNKLINVMTSPSTTQKNVISDRAITEKFKNLSFKCSKYPPLRRYENEVTAVDKFENDSESEGSDEEDLPETVQDITYGLEKRNISFNVELVTKDPWALLLKIDNGQNTTVIRALNMKDTKKRKSGFKVHNIEV